MFQLLGKVFNWNETTSSTSSMKAPKVKKINIAEVHAISNTVIKSEMYLPYYERPKPYKVFQLPTENHQKLYFIKDSKMIHDIISLETEEDNQNTVRKQRHVHNQALLHRNPVANSSMNSSNYAKEQHKLFVSLAMGIEGQIGQITTPSTFSDVHNKDLIRFVIASTAQCYLPMLLQVSAARVPFVLDDFIQLLDLLEAATGKHNITFGEYLASKNCEYNDSYERHYIPLFHKIVHTLKDAEIGSTKAMISSEEVEIYCQEIVHLLQDSSIVKVLLTQFDLTTEARVIVNNILSWMDNMLNVVHTVVNFIVLIGHARRATSASTSAKDIFTREFYQANLPRARALATMFMRHAISDFTITASDGTTVEFHKDDILMMSNGNEDTVFGGEGRKCPSRPWSYIFVEKMIRFILNHYEIESNSNKHGEVEKDRENDSWFWNKFSTDGCLLVLQS